MNLILPATTIDPVLLTEYGQSPGYFDAIVFQTTSEATARLDLAHSVPEPASLSLLAMSAIVLLRRRS
jgi:hypothetical protein